MPLFGPPNVEKLQSKGKVKALIKALDYEKDLEIARRAALALGALGDRDAVQPLVTKLRAGPTGVRQAAALALGRIGDLAAGDDLIAVLDDRDVREHAIEGLVALGASSIGPSRPEGND